MEQVGMDRPIFLEAIVPGKKIQAIKAIRSVTHKSLKEAKEIADDVEVGVARVISPTSDITINKAIAILEEHYVTVGERRDQQMFADEFIGQVIQIGVIEVFTLARGRDVMHCVCLLSFLDGTSGSFSGSGKTMGYALRDVREKIREATDR